MLIFSLVCDYLGEVKDKGVNMSFCHCVLPYTNPKACENCNNKNSNDYMTWKWTVPKKRIIKEYNEKGKLIKETIEEL